MRKFTLLFLMISLTLLCFALYSCDTAKSAYELYCEANPNYEGTEEEWLASLQGQNGKDGKSAYELYCEANPDYDGTEEEWLLALVNGELAIAKTHTVTFDLGFGGNKFTKEVKHGEKIVRPDDPERVGYKFESWTYIEDDENEKWSFIGYVVTDDITLYANWTYATLELPIINIDTNGATISSKEDYVDMIFSLENCNSGELDNITGGIRLRGNSTMGYEKKPYRIKFDKKQSLFGLDKAKSWVLLADYIDPSGLHNYTAFSLGNEMDGLSFTPSPHKVNVYLNGDFVGLYTLCEQVQENEGRMNIELDEILETMTTLKDFNFFISMDSSCVSDVGAILDETYFYIEEYDRSFELKYPEKSQFTSDAQFETFMAELKVYVKELMDAFYEKDVDKIRQEVNLNSLADYLIIDQIMGEHDHYSKSFNMYFTNTSDNPEENGKLNFGPIWDYDWSLHTPWTNMPNEYYEISNEMFYSNLFFQTMANTPELYQIVKTRYNEVAAEVLAEYIENFDEIYKSIDESLALNYKRWYSNLSSDITEKNVKFLKDFLVARKAQLDELWKITP